MVILIAFKVMNQVRVILMLIGSYFASYFLISPHYLEWKPPTAVLNSWIHIPRIKRLLTTIPTKQDLVREPVLSSPVLFYSLWNTDDLECTWNVPVEDDPSLPPPLKIAIHSLTLGLVHYLQAKQASHCLEGPEGKGNGG